MLRASPRALVQKLSETAEEAMMLTRFTRDLTGFWAHR